MSRNNFSAIAYRFSEKACKVADMAIVEAVPVENIATGRLDYPVTLLLDAAFNDNPISAEVPEVVSDTLRDSVQTLDDNNPLRAVVEYVAGNAAHVEAPIWQVVKRCAITKASVASEKRVNHLPYKDLKKFTDYRPVADGYVSIGAIQEWRWNKQKKNYLPHVVGARIQRIREGHLLDGTIDVGVHADGTIDVARPNLQTWFKWLDRDIHVAMRRLIPTTGYHRIAMGTTGAHIVSTGKA